jgi:indole-3-glycerol phosphate synthase
MDILEKIVAHKRKEVDERKSLYPSKLLEQSIYFETPVVSLRKYLLRKDKLGIIAEFKKKSPSEGDINPYAKVEQVSVGYMQGGASALSVLTDKAFFGGKNKDLTEARAFNFCPILRKDFVVDEYQIIEAKSIGADAVLLIAECLSAKDVKTFSALAKSLGLEVLLEVHSGEQLAKITPDIDLLGVNNRNLKTFEVGIATSLTLADSIPSSLVKISESGLRKAESVVRLKEAGYQGFLVGTHFMESDDPAKACAKFVQEIKTLEKLRRRGKVLRRIN